MSYKILSINPGPTSTKLGVYDGETRLFEETIRHTTEELSAYEKVIDQKDFRLKVILDVLEDKRFDLKTLKAVVGRGGSMDPLPGGAYAVNERLLHDAAIAKRAEHAANLGCHIANEIAEELQIPAFIVDSPFVDELSDLARVSGLEGYERESVFHALNQKAMGRRYADEIDVPYDELNLIVVHLGGGVSIGAHEKGRIVDVNNAYTGDGPFSPERAGGLPTGVVMKLCLSSELTKREIAKKLVGKGGYVSYFGTNDAREVKELGRAGDSKAKLIYEAMAYQVSKEIGACTAVLKGDVNAVIITGGIAYDEEFVKLIKERISFLNNIVVYPGEDEMLALTKGALRVLRGEDVAKIY
jgi:butyrate kinase